MMQVITVYGTSVSDMSDSRQSLVPRYMYVTDTTLVLQGTQQSGDIGAKIEHYGLCGECFPPAFVGQI